ncbi:MAG: Hpt domain-containing protein, partial [Phormidesmis sp.]
MLPEQQQRIMGYFIEEAKDHLNTIEQGLLSLQATIEDTEKANEIFRAAHSVKGGAAMLGLESIQQTAHRLEDYFKILKESPVQVDQALETMFLKVSDGLKDLLEQLEGPFGLTPDKAQEIMTDVEPVFGQLEAHLKTLVKTAVKTAKGVSAGTSLSGNAALVTPEAVQASFKRDIAALLRQMLATFKQPDTAETRKTIQDVCAQMHDVGKRFEFSAWCDLIETARLAAASLSNDYKALAPVLIREIKKAQDLVISGQASEVAVGDAMQALLPEDALSDTPEGLDNLYTELNLEQVEDLGEALGLESELADSLSSLNLASASMPEDVPEHEEISTAQDSDSGDEFELLFGNETGEKGLDDALTEDELESSPLGNADGDREGEPTPIERFSLDLEFDEIPSELSTLNRSAESDERADESLDALLATVSVTGPDVGTDELNSLADLFDGDLDELDNTLGGQAFISEEMQLHPERISASGDDFNDFLADAEDAADVVSLSAADGDADEGDNDEREDDLFGGTLTDGEFVIPDEEDWAIADDESNLLDTDSVSSESLLHTASQSVDIEDWSEDLWAEDDLLGEEQAGLTTPEAASITNSQAELSAELPDIAVPDLEMPDLAPLDLESPLDHLDLDELGSDDLGADELSSNYSSSDKSRHKDSGLEAARVLGYQHRVSPRELDIEFPTLTGVKLQAAEDDIDKFFVDEFEEEPIAGDQLADDPWGELPIEATLTGVKEPNQKNEKIEASAFLDLDPSRTFDEELNTEQTDSELDELLEDSSSGQNAAVSRLSQTDTSSDDLWNELVSPSEPAEIDAASAADAELASALLSDETDDDGFDSSDFDTSDFDTPNFDTSDFDTSDMDDEPSVETESPDDEFGEADVLAATSLEQDAHDAIGDELSDEVLADFETAFGSSSSDELSDQTIDFTAESSTAESSTAESAETDVDDLEIDVLEIDALEFNDLDVDDLDASNLNIDSLDVDDLLDFETLDAAVLSEAVAEPAAEVEEDNASDSFFEIIEENASVELGSELKTEPDDELALDDFGELSGFLTDDELDALEDEPPQIEQTLGDEVDDSTDEEVSDFDDLGFDDLDALLSEDLPTASSEASSEASSKESEESTFFDLGDLPTFVGDSSFQTAGEGGEDEDFDDLERLLEEGTDESAGAVSTGAAAQRRASQRLAKRSGSVRDQNMRVSVNHLDTLSNLVGELVVNRNTLERDQERLRQFLDNLLFQVQQLNDVGQRMRDLYERSLLESSLMSNRRAHSSENVKSADSTKAKDRTTDHATGETFDALEMDRFTGFHTLSQEMIELIVRVKESSSDIGYTVESSDQVTRQFRQITTQLQEGLNTARMIAFSQAADRLPRAVRDISLKCGKEARLIVEGQDTLIDKMIVEHLYDPLTHLVNNAITHGIETPAARRSAGKLAEGTITVRAFYQGNQTVIYVADDGGGIDTEFVKRKAIEKNLITQAEAVGLADLEVYELLFHPGFSTRDQADDFAGRGVGMDVVRTSLAEIRGSVTVDSELGQGTSFTIRLPLTL